VTGALLVKANVRFSGPGQIKFGANSKIQVYGDDVTIEDLGLDGDNVATSTIGILVAAASTATVVARTTIRRCRLVNIVTDGIRVTNAVSDFKCVDNVFSTGCNTGISVNTTAGVISTGIEISRNVFRGTTGLGIQLFGGTGIFSKYLDVNIQDNHMSSMGAAAIPIEATGCERLVVSGNIIGPATRGVSMGNGIDTVCSHNVIVSQTIYAFEGNNLTRCVIANNLVVNCASLFRETGATTGNADIRISDNLCVGTGLTALVSGSNYVRIVGAANVVIENNTFRSLEFIAVPVRVGYGATADRAVVRNNHFLVDTANAPARCIDVNFGTDCTVEGNVVSVTRALAAADDNLAVISLVLGGNVVGLRVANNRIIYSGAVTAAPNHVGIGTPSTGANTLPRSAVVGNVVVNGVVGFDLRSTSADTVFADNDGRTCTAELGVINAAIIFRRTKRFYEATAAPTTGTWQQGDRVWNTTPAAGGVPGWVCVTAGTPGTWKAMAVLAA
jgi:hypothetical protein